MAYGAGGLTCFAGNVGGTAKAPIHRYSFPAQETELRGDEDLRAVGGKPFGKVNAISLDDRTVDIKKRQDSASLHPEAIFSHKVIGTEEQAEALVRIAEYVIANGMKGPGRYQAARDLLLFDAPKIGGQPIRNVDETTLSAAVRISPAFEPCVFPIQGPPGAGKTHTGARMICALVATGKKVGITANSHKVIRNLLDEIQRACKQSGKPIQSIQKLSEKADDVPGIRFTTDNAKIFSSLGPDCPVAGGTSWLWARPEAFEALDVLFVDEAAQMSLANVLAVSHAAKTVVLLGERQAGDRSTLVEQLLCGQSRQAEILPPGRLYLAAVEIQNIAQKPACMFIRCPVRHIDRSHLRQALDERSNTLLPCGELFACVSALGLGTVYCRASREELGAQSFEPITQCPCR